MECEINYAVGYPLQILNKINEYNIYEQNKGILTNYLELNYILTLNTQEIPSTNKLMCKNEIKMLKIIKSVVYT
jgi:hypothetical protein